MGKIALVVPNNLWVCPYVSIYTRAFDKIGAGYEIISWNRAGKEETGIQYNRLEKTRNLFGILWSYHKFAYFVKKMLSKDDYDKVVVFSPQLAIFLAGYLKINFKDCYIVDYRDLSIEQKKPFCWMYKNVLSNSFANVVSSPGFLKFLPKGYEYVISHNFKLGSVRYSNERETSPIKTDNVIVLTIGAIRDDRNREVIDALGNQQGFILKFVGKGFAAKPLEEYSKEKGYTNVEFTGYYDKTDEPDIIRECTLINIVYPLIPSHISALSNRFYNSLIFRRPMIVTRNTIQGDYAEKYGVGLVIDNCDHLKEEVHNYLKSFDVESYGKRCDKLLSVFVEENQLFEKMLNKFAVSNYIQPK